MNEKETDFLSLEQRTKFIFAVLPIIDVLAIVASAYYSPKPWLSVGVGLLVTICGGSCLILGRKTGRAIFFSRTALALNGINTAMLCAVSGPEAPSFIMGMAMICAGALFARHLKELLICTIYVFLAVAIGSYIGGKTILAIATALSILLCYSIVVVRLLQFTVIQENEIIRVFGELKVQKKLIEKKNTSITDSINYALRIQQAKLPDLKTIYAALPQSFVLFKPKDIVSGDFYAFHQKENVVYIAAGDCTGHGVPGALMSMIGLDKLEDANLP